MPVGGTTKSRLRRAKKGTTDRVTSVSTGQQAFVDKDRPGRTKRQRRSESGPNLHHVVYVVYLRNPRGDGKAGYYVGMTGLTPEQRLANHKAGIKAAAIVRRCGVRLVPKLTQHLGPMSYTDALAMEKRLFEELQARGYQVFGGH
jgi:predicted GIY-YIG superfamily endonuclease